MRSPLTNNWGMTRLPPEIPPQAVKIDLFSYERIKQVNRIMKHGVLSNDRLRCLCGAYNSYVLINNQYNVRTDDTPKHY